MSRAKIAAAAFPSLALAPLVPLLMASCAETDEARPIEEDASSVIQPPEVDASASDASDAGLDCDAGDPDCVANLLTCDEADFCPMPSGVDRRHALTAVWGSGAKDVWAVGSGGTITHWDGAAWKRVPSSAVETFNAVWGSSASDVWVGGSSDAILHGTGYAGGSAVWTPAPAFVGGDEDYVYPARVHAIWGANATDVRVGGAPLLVFTPDDTISGNLLHRTSADAGSGTGWEVQSGLDGRWFDATVRAIWGSSARDVWIALDNGNEEPWARGTIAHGTAGAAGDPLSWTSIDSKSTAPLESIWGSSATDVWAVGGNGIVRRFTGGASFAIVDGVPTTAALHGVWGSGRNDVWVVGDSGTILHYDGAAWSEATVAFPLGRKPNLKAVWGSGPNDVWVVGDAFALHFTGKKAGR
ncbi:MAG: hypothetical protein KF894_17085 [Labilithrix sp.]|nr:hypothetical protein [Labilithrix sp.]